MPPEISHILTLALLNPAVVIAGFLIGRRADQPQKIVIAGFVAALAGTAFAWALMGLGLTTARPRLLMGIFIVALAAGMLAAWLGWRTRK
jgi:acyl-coenzyme A thioesterase PaaI-like protein